MIELSDVDARPLFRPLSNDFIELVRSFDPEMWNRPTCYPTWRVREIVSHLVQTALTRISIERDRFLPTATIESVSFSGLSDHIDTRNDAWATATSGLSPELLVEFVEFVEPRLVALIENTDIRGEATFAVAWAGETNSRMRFDIAREFTERWHHQQQIREAVRTRSITETRYLVPVIKTFVQCLPYWFREISVEAERCIKIEITGASGGVWELFSENGVWKIAERNEMEPDAIVRLTDDTAWRFWSRSVTEDEAAERIEFEGELPVRDVFLKSRAVMIANMV